MCQCTHMNCTHPLQKVEDDNAGAGNGQDMKVPQHPPSNPAVGQHRAPGAAQDLEQPKVKEQEEEGSRGLAEQLASMEVDEDAVGNDAEEEEDEEVQEEDEVEFIDMTSEHEDDGRAVEDDDDDE